METLDPPDSLSGIGRGRAAEGVPIAPRQRTPVMLQAPKPSHNASGLVQSNDGEGSGSAILKRLVLCLCAYSLIGSSVTLVGWFGHAPRLTDWFGSRIAMFPNTAVAALLASIGIALSVYPVSRFHQASRILATVVALIGGATLLQHLLAVDLRIDEILIDAKWGQRAAASPGRMGPPASTSFLLLGSALCLLRSRFTYRRLVPVLGLVTLGISALGIIGYLFHADPLFSHARLTGIALQTTTIICALALALLASAPDLQPVCVLLADSAAGGLVRRALPFVILLPLVLCGLFIFGRNALWFDRGMGAALLALTLMTLLCGLLWWSAAHVARHESLATQTRARLQSLLSLMPAAVYACDAKGRITFYNREAAELWGREPALNDDHQKFCAACRCWFNGAVLAPENTPMAIAVREGKSFRNLEPEFERPDGVRVSVLVNIDPVLDAEGKPAGAINVFQDVTVLKHAEAELRRKNAQLAAFLDTAALGLHRVGPDGIIQWANAAELQMLGYTPEEYIGHHITEFHADGPVIDDILKRLARGEKLCEREARLRCKDGSIKHVLIDSSVLWEDGKFIHTQCFTRDVTDRKRDEETAALLAAIVEHTDDAIFSTNLEGIIQSWNRGAERLYGYSAEEAIGRPISILVPEGHDDEQPRILENIRHGQTVENYETTRRRKDGTVFHVSLTVSPVKDRKGTVVGVSKVARDITEKIRAREILEETVSQRTTSLEQALAQMEDFTYTVSHDLRAPVRAIRGITRVIIEDHAASIPVETRDFLNRIISSAERMDQLIRDLLDYSRASRAQIQLAPVELDRLISSIITERPDMQPERAEISIRAPLDPVLAHETCLSQAITNLLANAVKFVPAGVTPKVQLWTERAQGSVRLWVADNGIGINPKYHHRLFNVFERVHESTHYEGTGIGLAIVRKAAEKMGGKVGVVSDGRSGSSFWIELPAASL